MMIPGLRRSSTLSIDEEDNNIDVDNIDDNVNVNITPLKHIGIIGGGVSGIATAKSFKEQGHIVTLFERLPSLGGVWHESRSYPGVETQSPQYLYKFSDLAYPDDTPEWPSGQDVLKYLQSYAEKHDLVNCIRYESTVEGMKERIDEYDENVGWALNISTPSREYSMEFDYIVICNGTFTNKRMISHPNQESFVHAGGIITHSSDYKDDIPLNELKGRDVVVIGGSKSATDVAVHASNSGANQVTLVMRRNVWRVPRFVGGLINFKHLLYMRAQEIQFHSWKIASPLSLLLWYIATPLVYMNFLMLELLLILQLGLRKWNMMPTTRIKDSVSCEIPIVTEGFTELIESGDIVPITSEVQSYQGKNLTLTNGEEIKADVVIQATGWTLELPFLPDDIKNKLIDEKDGLFRLYRFAVNPTVPNIGFVGYNSSFCTILSSELISRWLVRYVDGVLANQKSNEEMDEEVGRLLQWKREVYPASSVYKGNCIAPFHHLHFDELLDDMGAKVKNTSMFSYPDAELYGRCMDSAPMYCVGKSV